MKILFTGTPSSASIVLKGLVSSGHDVTAVLTREDSEVGRKRILTPSPVAVTAEQLGIKVIKSNRISDETLSQIVKTGAEIAIVVAYGSILNSKALKAVPNGWFNLHYSLLPKYRGAAPVQHALIEGEQETGITLFKLDEGMDTGPILSTLPVSIELNENAGDLIQRMSALGVTLLNQEMPKIYNGEPNLTPQTGTPSFAPKILRADAHLDFNIRAQAVVNFVRGMNPEPMAWANVGEQTVRVLSAVETHTHDGYPGQIIHSDKAVVVCGEGTAIELLEVQPAGKNPMAGLEWIRGLRGQEVLT